MRHCLSTKLIELNNVGVQRDKRWLIHDINLTVNAGEIITIIGPNGAGKTTLLKVLLGLWQPTQGSVWRLPQLQIGYTPQNLQVEATLPLTVERFLQLSGVTQRNELLNILKLVGLSVDLNHSFHALSGGESQRVLLARALLRKPQLLVLDEPAQGVDINGQVELYELLSKISQERGCSIVQVSHDLHLVMASSNYVICLNQHICCSGHPDTISQNPEFINLFGNAAQSLAFYHHQHNHKHTATGEVIHDADH
jgi:zinc transport system ATP-binding protein